MASTARGYRPQDPSPRFLAKEQQWMQTKLCREWQDEAELSGISAKRREELRRIEKEKAKACIEWEEHGRQLHRSNMKVRRERELGDVRWKERNRAEEEQVKAAINQRAQGMLLDELDKFEDRLTRMGLDAKSKRVQDANLDDRESLKQMIAAQSEVPHKHLEKLSALAQKGLAETQADSDQYLERMQRRKVEDTEARKEREKRRRKMLLDQQRNFRSIDEQRRHDLLLQKLACVSRQERAIAQELHQQAQWKEVIVRNRMEREAQYAQRRQQDCEEEQQRQRELAERERRTYLQQRAAEQQKWQGLWAQKQARKQAKHWALCQEVVLQVLDLVDHVVGYCETTGEVPQGCLLVPKPLWRQWKTLFLHGQSPGADAVPASDPGSTAASPAPPPGEGDSEVATLLNGAELQDYLSHCNEWALPPPHPNAPSDWDNPHLADIVYRLQRVVRPEPPPCAPPPTEKVTVVLLGKPLSGKSMAAQECAKALGLAYLNPTEMVEAAARPFDVDQDQAMASLPLAQRELHAQFLALGRGVRQLLLAGEEVDELALLPLLVNRLQFLQHDPSNQGVLLDGIPATAVGFQELEKQLSGYDAAQRLPLPPKLLLPPPPAAPLSPPPSSPTLEALRALARQEPPKPILSPTLPRRASAFESPAGREGRKSSKARGSKLDGKKATTPMATAEDPGTVGRAEGSLTLATPPAEMELPPDSDVSGLDLVIHLTVPNAAVFSRFAGQRQDPMDGRRYHLEYAPPPLDRWAALQPVPQPAASDHALLQEKLLHFNHEAKRIEKWLQKFGILVELEGDCCMADLQADLTLLVQYRMAEKRKVRRAQGHRDQAPAPLQPPPPAAAAPLDEIPEPVCVQEREGRITPQVAEMLLSQWDSMEVWFEKGATHIFAALRSLRKTVTEHLVVTQEQFGRFLVRPDSKQADVSAFQTEFNGIESILRSDEETKAELHLRTDQLQDSLWHQNDARRDGGRAEVKAFREEEWMEVHRKAVRRQFAQLMQLEVDRFLHSRLFTMDYYCALCGIDNSEFTVPLEFDAILKPGSSDHKRRNSKKPSDKKEEKAKDDRREAKGTAKAAEKAGRKGKAAAEEHCEEEDVLPAVYEAAIQCIRQPLELAHVEDDEERARKPRSTKKGAKEEEDKPHARPLPAGMLAVCAMEGELCIKRVALIREKAADFLDEVEAKHVNLQQKMDASLSARYSQETRSTADLIHTIRTAIEEENPLPFELRLEGAAFVVDEGARLLQLPEPLPPSKSGRPGLASADDAGTPWLTSQQSSQLVEKFRRMSPTGQLSKAGFFRLFMQMAATNQQPATPVVWTLLEQPHFDMAFSAFDVFDCGSIDWREFMVSSLLWRPSLPCPSLAELLALREACRQCVAGDPAQRLTRAQCLGLPFWFSADRRTEEWVGALWEIFHTTVAGEPGLHFPTMLLFLSSDPQVVRGVQKGFLMLSEADGRLSSELLHELFHFNDAAPDAQAPFCREAIDGVFQAVSSAAGVPVPRISFTDMCGTHLGRVIVNSAKMFLKKEVRVV